jgi:hypothetical protein
LNIKEMMEEWTLANDSQEYIRALQDWGQRYDLYLSGYLPSTMQRVFSVMMKKSGENNAKIKEGITILAPLSKAVPNNHGLEECFYVDIFEHTLSRDGVFWMMVAKDLSVAHVLQSIYFREAVEFTGTLDEVLRYVAENHWYGY